MGYLNTPELVRGDIDERYEKVWFYAEGLRRRLLTIEAERWVGGDYDVAKDKADELASLDEYTTVRLIPGDGGFWDVQAVKTTEGAWEKLNQYGVWVPA